MQPFCYITEFVLQSLTISQEAFGILKCVQRVFTLIQGIQFPSFRGNVCAGIVMAGLLLTAVEAELPCWRHPHCRLGAPQCSDCSTGTCNAVVFLGSSHCYTDLLARTQHGPFKHMSDTTLGSERSLAPSSGGDLGTEPLSLTFLLVLSSPLEAVQIRLQFRLLAGLPHRMSKRALGLRTRGTFLTGSFARPPTPRQRL